MNSARSSWINKAIIHYARIYQPHSDYSQSVSIVMHMFSWNGIVLSAFFPVQCLPQEQQKTKLIWLSFVENHWEREKKHLEMNTKQFVHHFLLMCMWFPRNRIGGALWLLPKGRPLWFDPVCKLYGSKYRILCASQNELNPVFFFFSNIIKLWTVLCLLLFAHYSPHTGN